jgi:NAD-dependent SIR2 family protein deacetylase
MFPGRHKPTPTHAFLRLLQDKGLLLRCYTQNIDTLERVAGIRPEKLVEAHGTYASASCVECHGKTRLQSYRDEIDAGRVPRCGRTLGIPPPEPPPAAEAVAAARAELQAAQEAKAAVSMTSVPLGEYINLGIAVGRVEDKLRALEAAIADHPGLRQSWAAAPKTRVCPGLVKSDVVFFGEKTAVGAALDFEFI